MAFASVVGRGIGLVILLGLSWQLLARGTTISAPGIVLGIVDGANLIFHEAGHILFLFFGEFLQALGGSLTQVAIPVLCSAYFLLHHQPAAAAVTLFWTGESITHVAVYVADARVMRLPLLGGDEAIHDWNYLLGRLNLVNQSEILGRLVFGVGLMIILAALGLLAAGFVRSRTQASRQDAF